MNAWLRIDFECAAWQLAELSACLEALGAKAVSCVAAENQPDLFVEDVNQEGVDDLDDRPEYENKSDGYLKIRNLNQGIIIRKQEGDDIGLENLIVKIFLK